MNINKFFVAGRITGDIEMRTTPNGSNVATIPVAVNRTYINKNTNQKVEETTWLRLTAWGKQAQTIAQYFVKGQVIYAECRIDNKQWEKKDGTKVYDYAFIIQDFQFGAKPNGAQGSAPRQQRPTNINTPPEDVADPYGSGESSIDTPGQDFNVEDIPF